MRRSVSAEATATHIAEVSLNTPVSGIGLGVPCGPGPCVAITGGEGCGEASGDGGICGEGDGVYGSTVVVGDGDGGGGDGGGGDGTSNGILGLGTIITVGVGLTGGLGLVTGGLVGGLGDGLCGGLVGGRPVGGCVVGG